MNKYEFIAKKFPEVKASDLVRLIEGDLSHIGDGMVNGNMVQACLNTVSIFSDTDDSYDFSASPENYRIKPKELSPHAKMLVEIFDYWNDNIEDMSLRMEDVSDLFGIPVEVAHSCVALGRRVKANL